MVTPGSLFDPELGQTNTTDDSTSTKSSNKSQVTRPVPSNIYDKRSETFKKFLTKNKKSPADEEEEESLLAQANAAGAKSPLSVAPTTSMKKSKATDSAVAAVNPSTAKDTEEDMPIQTGDSEEQPPTTTPATPTVPNVIPGPNLVAQADEDTYLTAMIGNANVQQGSDVSQTPMQPARNELLEAAIGKESKKKITADVDVKDEKAKGTGKTTVTADKPATAQIMLTNAPAPIPTNQVQSIAQATNDTQGAQAALNKRVESIQMIEKLVGSLVQQIKPDKTETTITLKNLPLFKDVTLVLTEYNTSQKEFNLTFYNLTNPEARNLILNNQNALRESLIEKGYTLQMLTIEPKIETSASTSEETTSQRGDQEQQMAGGGGGASGESTFDEGGVT